MICPEPKSAERVSHERTGVGFRILTDDEIHAYVATGEPMDKAGAYAIQGGAGMFVTGLDGAEDNVIGLPVGLVENLLRELGWMGSTP